MATITGTSQSETLIGTDAADLLLPYGVGPGQAPDFISGGNGGDTYDLAEPVGEDPAHRYIIDDAGTDGATDRIDHAGALIHTASLGYIGFATALRDGDDLLIVTPSKPHRFRDPALPSYEITILDHYGDGAVEWLQAGTVTYALAAGATGSAVADILAGTIGNDLLRALGGNDYVTGNGGDDDIRTGSGDDYAFGGAGGDTLRLGTGDDHGYGDNGADTVMAGAGQDFVYAGTGDDLVKGQAGNDFLFGQDGNDTLAGGAGQDMLSGGRGDDIYRGGTGGDTYRHAYDVDAYGTLDDGGHDIIRDRGEKPAWNDYDRIELFGYYGPSSGSTSDAYARLAFVRDGKDMKMLSDGGASSITVKGQFGANKFAIEELHFNAGYWTPLRFRILDGAKVEIGDDRDIYFGTAGEWNELLFGTDAADQVFGNAGTNFIWLGAGADTLIYKAADPQLWYGVGGGPCNDIVQDFDLAEDRMDFTEIGGLSLAGLTVADNARGNAQIHWDSGTWEIADINIELRGVAAADLTADHFVF